VADVMTKPENPNKHLLKQIQKIHYEKKNSENSRRPGPGCHEMMQLSIA
jgi:hypothetical protein